MISNVSNLLSSPKTQFDPSTSTPPSLLKSAADKGKDGAVRKAFDSFVGEAFYGQMLKAMRQTVGEPAYFHGGRAEEVFQAQLDQILSEKMAEASGSKLTGPMYDLFSLNRQ
jgi:Rod binding domain-containing protein